MLFVFAITLCALSLSGCMADEEVALSPACEELKNCTTALDDLNMKESMGLMTSLMSSSPGVILDSFCGQAPQIISCINDKRSACSDSMTLTTAQVALDILDYTCDNANRAEMEEVMSSDCISSDSLETSFLSSLSNCSQTLLMNVRMVGFLYAMREEIPPASAFCPAMVGFKNCIISDITDLCGSAFGRYASRLWDLSVRAAGSSTMGGMAICFHPNPRTPRSLELATPEMIQKTSNSFGLQFKKHLGSFFSR